MFTSRLQGEWEWDREFQGEEAPWEKVRKCRGCMLEEVQAREELEKGVWIPGLPLHEAPAPK